MIKKFFYLSLVVVILLGLKAEAANFSFESNVNLKQTCSAPVGIAIDTEGEIANSADAFIYYNPGQIQIEDVYAGSAFKYYGDPIIDSSNGIVKFTGYGGKFSGKGTFAYLKVKSNPGVNNSKLTWDFNFGSTTDSNIGRRSDAVDILTGVYDGNLNFAPGACEDDKAGPEITNQTPGPGSTNQPLDSTITFTIEDLFSGVDINSVVVTLISGDNTTSYDVNKFTSVQKGTKAYDIKVIPYPEFTADKPVYVDVISKDMSGNSGRSSWNFNNTANVYECKYLSLVAIPGSKKVDLAWTGLSALGYEGISIRKTLCGSDFSFPETPSSNESVYEGTDIFYQDNNVINGTQYCYSAFAYKNTENGKQYSQGAFSVGTPSCYVQPISDFILRKDDSGIALTWQNNAFSNVKIIRKENGCPSGWSSGDWQTLGRVVYDGSGNNFIDTSIKGDNNYCYLALANDDEGCFSPGVLAGASIGSYIEIENPSLSQELNYLFYTNNGILPLSIYNNEVNLLTGKDLTIVTQNKFEKPIENIIAQVGSNMYTFTYDKSNQQYSLKLNNFDNTGQSDGKLMVVYTDKTAQETPFKINVVAPGSIYTGIGAIKSPVGNAEVGLYTQNGDLFVGVNQPNPIVIDENGKYGFMVPTGSYKIIVKKDGETQFESDVFSVENNLVNYDINIIGQSVVEAVIPVEVQKAIVKTVTQTTKQVQEIIEIPEVQTVNKAVVAPAITAIATANLVASVPWWNFWYYFQYMFTEFIPWILFRKRKGWGVVYNSITKKPIDLAVVRLYDAITNKLIKTKITDRKGRYMFLVDSGNYYVKVDKSGFEFPSNILMKASYDKEYIDIYHGEKIEIKPNEKGVIIANIPLDQEEVKYTNAQLLRNYFWGGLRKNLSLVGPIFSLIALIVSPSWIMFGMTIFHMVLFFLFKRLAKKEKKKYWGIVYDNENRKPLAHAIAKVFAPEYNKMLEATVTDKYGRYGFLAENNTYYITGEKSGYETYKTENISLSDVGNVLGKDLPLNKSLIVKNQDNKELKKENIEDAVTATEAIKKEAEKENQVDDLKKENIYG